MKETINGSFRDPSNFVYMNNGTVFRKIMPSGFDDYDFLIGSRLYEHLAKNNLLIVHEEISRNSEELIIKPEMIPFISYPYEWCFSQLKDAALLTLNIQKIAMNYGMSLKDASAYNVQFLRGKPIFIDTMSFEKITPSKPWIAYRQFCQHFLAPLALMSHTDLRLNKLLTAHIDGIPLDMAAKLLPLKTRFSLGLYFHIHLHAKFQKTANVHKRISSNTSNFSLHKLKALIEHLETTITNLKLNKTKTEWDGYYDVTNYSTSAFDHKKQIISAWLETMQPRSLLDVGSNDGSLTTLATEKKIFSIAADIDPITVEKCYMASRKKNDIYMLPLQLDLANPSPSIGWHHKERERFADRANTDCVMALALIHHLAITNNIPLKMAANYFADITSNLIIEFVPKSDSMVQRMLKNRKDTFDTYHIDHFEACFMKYFRTEQKEKIAGSDRILFWMKKA